MSDENLRALEREAAAGEVGARLRLAATLERGGEHDRALRVLLAGRQDAEARRQIGRWPVWNGGNTIGGPQSFIDVPPLRAPRVEWTFAGCDVDRGPLRQVFLGSAHALVCRSSSGRSVVLDGLTGQPRWPLPEGWPDGEPHAAIVGDVLLVGRTTAEGEWLEGRDLWSGELLHATNLGGAWTLLPHQKLVLVERGPRAFAYRLADARRAPEVVWGIDLRPRTDRDRAERFVEVAGLVVDRAGEPGFMAVDGATGRLAWHLSDPIRLSRADEHGIVASRVTVTEQGLRDSGTICSYDPNGRLVWESDSRGWVFALGPQFLFAMVNGPRTRDLVTLDRLSGDVLHLVGHLADFGAVALVNGALYSYLYLLTFESRSMEPMCLRALTPKGAELWRMAPEQLGGDVFGIAPVPECVYVLGRSGLITCLVDSR